MIFRYLGHGRSLTNPRWPPLIRPSYPAIWRLYSKNAQTFKADTVKSKQNANSKPSTKKSTQKQTSKTVKAVDHSKTISLPPLISLLHLSSLLGVTYTKLQNKCRQLNLNYGPQSMLTFDMQANIAIEYNLDAVENVQSSYDLFPSTDDQNMKPRPPIVTIMGHVDHGKTTLLDKIRKTSVVKGEFGGITQHIGAFSVSKDGRNMTFLDTPGHAAFLAMRERGANVTDIVVLVVAVDDGVMPQTLESIRHARKYNVPIIVAMNKADKKNANPDKVKADLLSHGIEMEDYGGEIQGVMCSGKTGMGIQELEEAIITLAEVNDLHARYDGPAEGYVIESSQKIGLGNTTTMLVNKGTLKVGASIVAGINYCKVKKLVSDKGVSIKIATPGMPVVVSGWKELPNAGELILEAPTEKLAKQAVNNRINRKASQAMIKEAEEANARRVEEQTANAETQGQKKEALFIVKGDVSGSVEAIVDSIVGLGNKDVGVRVLSSGIGELTPSDIELAEVSNAEVLLFNIPGKRYNHLLDSSRPVTITDFNVIYSLIGHVTDRLVAMLPPIVTYDVSAEADIIQPFSISLPRRQEQLVAGCRVTSGKLLRKNIVRVLRAKKIIWEGELQSLRHFKEEVNEIQNGMECGLAFKDWEEFEAGDKLQSVVRSERPNAL